MNALVKSDLMYLLWERFWVCCCGFMGVNLGQHIDEFKSDLGCLKRREILGGEN